MWKFTVFRALLFTCKPNIYVHTNKSFPKLKKFRALEIIPFQENDQKTYIWMQEFIWQKDPVGWGDITHLYHICFIWGINGFLIRESRNLYPPLVKSQCFWLCVSFVWPEIKQIFSSESLATYITRLFRCDSISQHLPLSVSGWVSESLSEWLIVSDLEIAIASPSFASLLYVARNRRIFSSESLATYTTRRPSARPIGGDLGCSHQ